MTDHKELIAEARNHAKLFPSNDGSALRIRSLADALEESERERDALTATLERVRGVIDRDVEVLANLDPAELKHILNSAPPVARPLPDREALVDVLLRTKKAELDAAFEEAVAARNECREVDPRRSITVVADAVLAAIETAPVVSDDTEWEYQCRVPGFSWSPCGSEGTAKYCPTGTTEFRRRTRVGPWVAIEKGGE